jgi:hypothetical protein
MAVGEDNVSSASKTCNTANRLALVDNFNPTDRAETSIFDQRDEDAAT